MRAVAATWNSEQSRWAALPIYRARRERCGPLGVGSLNGARGKTDAALASVRGAHQDHSVQLGTVDQHSPRQAIALELAPQAVFQQVGG